MICRVEQVKSWKHRVMLAWEAITGNAMVLVNEKDNKPQETK